MLRDEPPSLTGYLGDHPHWIELSSDAWRLIAASLLLGLKISITK
jgi:hypothetical protein